MTTHQTEPELAPRYRIGVLNKAFDLLDVLEQNDPLTLTELSKQLATNKVTALRILANLQARGYVERDDLGRYSLGLRLLELGLRKSAATDLRSVAHPILRELRDRFDETVNLGIPDGAGILYIDILESSLGLRMAATVGARDDIHSTAIGKAIASNWDDNRLARVLSMPLHPKTARTITNAAQLSLELDTVRGRGYSVDNEENETGARCIGAPVFDHTGDCAGAISVSGPTIRMTEDRFLHIAAEVQAAAARISERLGFRP
ncbi:MAG: IclR family transcriptional regulator [Thermomicrobiales bacterium]|nr:IclR family transcriptional regulator [Thermomicrobiales bacterium]MCO5223029.1 IclR family transcriptional regulator [Thermomicrobiales bacterium]